MRRFLPRLVVTLLAVTACARAPAQIGTRAGDLVITDVTVVPMDRDGTLAHHTVVVRGDRIVAVAPNARVTRAAGATHVDGEGKWLMPGLADMHVHTWSEHDLTMFVTAGVTTVRNMYGSDQHLAWRREIAAGRRFGPTLLTASPIIDGDPPTWPNSIVLTDPAKADALVADLKAKGYDALKPYSGLTPAAYDALVAAAGKHGMHLDGHVPREVGLPRALAAKQRTIEHLDGYLRMLLPADVPPTADFWATMRAALPRLDETRLPALAQQTKAAGTWNCATLVVHERLSALDDAAALAAKAKWLHLIAPSVRATWDPKQDFRIASRSAEDLATMRATNAVRARIVRALAAGGAPLLVGTDTGNPFVIPGEAMHDEIELLVAAGIPRAQVLRAATAEAGRFVGTRDGTITPGARADLLLVDVDPLARPLPLVPDGVVLRGSWLPKAALEAKLAALAPAADSDRWRDVPALAAEGTEVRVAHYELRRGGALIGEERVAIGRAGAQRVIVAQVALDQPGRIVTTYRIAPDATAVTSTSAFGTVALTAKRAGTDLVATGTDARGTAVRASHAFAPGAVLAGPGVGGAVGLAAALAALPVGGTRTLASLELATFPRAGLEAATLTATRLADADGDRRYELRIAFDGTTIASALTVDPQGVPVAQSFGPPLNLAFARVR